MRAIKRIAKRHHLHPVVNADEELLLTPHSLLVNKDSRELISARGIFEDSDITVSLRSLALPAQPGRFVTIITTPLLFGLELVALSRQLSAHLNELITDLHPDWQFYPTSTHHLALSVSASEEQLNATRHALTHLPQELSAEVSDQHLSIFSVPQLDDEQVLETNVRLTVELKHLFVTA